MQQWRWIFRIASKYILNRIALSFRCFFLFTFNFSLFHIVSFSFIPFFTCVCSFSVGSSSALCFLLFSFVCSFVLILLVLFGLLLFAALSIWRVKRFQFSAQSRRISCVCVCERTLLNDTCSRILCLAVSCSYSVFFHSHSYFYVLIPLFFSKVIM